MRRTSLLLLALWIASGCETPVGPQRLSTVFITPYVSTMAPGQTLQLTANAYDTRGDLMSAKFTWTVAAGSASVQVDASGLVTAIAQGEATIRASAGEVSGTAQITVAIPPPPEDLTRVVRVSVWPSVAIVRGSTTQLHAGAYNVRNEMLPNAAFEWSSSAPDIASVNVLGVVKGLAIGRSTISAATNGIAGSAVIDVTDSVAPTPTPPTPTPPPWGGGFSCPLVYSWDGAEWHLDSGTFGGAIAPGLARTDVDVLDHATAQQGRLRLRMTNELRETEHVDGIEVVAVDHAPGTIAAPDPLGGIHVLRIIAQPKTASDFDGRDARELLAAADGRAWQSASRERDASRATGLRDGLVLTFPRPASARRAWLVVDAQNTPWATKLLGQFLDAQGIAVNGWYALMGIRPLARAAQSRFIREGFLHVAVADASAPTWSDQAFLWEAGPEVMKRQVVPLDLRDVHGDLVRVRLQAPPGFWRIDAVALGLEEAPRGGAAAGSAVAVPRTLQLLAASARRRNVAPVLRGVDGQELTMETGDTVQLVFADPVPAGSAVRTYLLRSSGWYRVHSKQTGLPRLGVLARLLVDRDGMARMAVEQANGELRERKVGYARP